MYINLYQEHFFIKIEYFFNSNQYSQKHHVTIFAKANRICKSTL